MNKSATEVFDDWAATGRAEGMEVDHGVSLREALKDMDLQPGLRVLDLGCGNGWATRLIAGITGAPALGVDGATGMVERARELSAADINVTFEQANFKSLPADDASIDRLFSMEALYYAHDLEAVLAEIRRVLKPAGRADILINFFTDNSTVRNWPELLGVHMHALSEKDWAETFRKAGFVDVATRRVIGPDGPGEEKDFTPSRWCASWDDHLANCSNGTLWIIAHKPD